MKYILSIITCTLLFSHTLLGQDTTWFDSNWEPTAPEDAYVFRVDNNRGQHWDRQEFYVATGKVILSGRLSSIDPETRNGMFEYHHKNGQLKFKGRYLQDEPEGKHVWYYENGELQAEEYYQHGELHGDFKEYYDNGQISLEAVYRNGKKHGPATYYNEDGTVHSYGPYHDDIKEGIWSFYDEESDSNEDYLFRTRYFIYEGNLHFRVPNHQWDLIDYEYGRNINFMFKRMPEKDTLARPVVPLIMAHAEDARKHRRNPKAWSEEKRKFFISEGTEILEVLTPDDDDFPLALKKNAFFIKSRYTENDREHHLYMIHYMTPKGLGIELYFDVTTETEEAHEEEFLMFLDNIRITKNMDYDKVEAVYYK
ncbi:toxin-antitoxin system YwqK family antitoxin [Cytophagaceae bacterium ABcell3]|nr:toxin-antitoxin system YwqK family antitoxin [Cytophagaceae bacterium ABcell3]